MAYEHLITADWHDVDIFSSTSGTIARSSVTARTGAWSFRVLNSGLASLNVASNATKYVGVGMYSTQVGTQTNQLFLREGGTTHLVIQIAQNSGVVEVRRGSNTGTLLGSGGSVSMNKWYYVGVKATIHDSTGVVEVYLDGVKIIDLTGQDTRNGGASGVIDNVAFQSNYGDHYYDDIKVRDDAVPGVGGIYVKVPSADGGTNDWTPSAGSEYQCVDEAPPTFTDYISTDAATTNTLSNFAHAGLSAAAYDSIACVCVAASAKLDASGSGNVRMVLNSNGTESDGSSTVLSTSAKYIHHFVTADPDTSAAWTKSGVDAALFGVETI